MRSENPILEALPGDLGKSGTSQFISWELGNKCQYLGVQGNKDNIGEHGTKAFYFMGTGEQMAIFRGTGEKDNIGEQGT